MSVSGDTACFGYHLLQDKGSGADPGNSWSRYINLCSCQAENSLQNHVHWQWIYASGLAFLPLRGLLELQGRNVLQLRKIGYRLTWYSLTLVTDWPWPVSRVALETKKEVLIVDMLLQGKLSDRAHRYTLSLAVSFRILSFLITQFLLVSNQAFCNRILFNFKHKVYKYNNIKVTGTCYSVLQTLVLLYKNLQQIIDLPYNLQLRSLRILDTLRWTGPTGSPTTTSGKGPTATYS